MTPDQARELLIQAKCEQVAHKGYRDALHLVSGLRYEYAVQVFDNRYVSQPWVYLNHGHFVWTPGEAHWYPSEAEAIDAVPLEFRPRQGEELPSRLIRRLVSAPEVIE